MSNRYLPFWFFVVSLCCFPSFSRSQEETESNQDTNHYYPSPGIVVFRNGRWMGSDYLYNLSNNIPVFVEIVKPKGATIPITKEAIQQHMMEIFQKANINPTIKTPQEAEESRKPPLPFFHVLIMVYPLENLYVALCEGRLLERVILDRVTLLPENTFQAITWDMETLILSPEKDFVEQLKKSLDRIGSDFTDRFRFYEGVRSQIKTTSPPSQREVDARR